MVHKGHKEVADKQHLFKPLLKEMMRLNQRLTQIKMLFAYSLVEDEYLQRPQKSPEFTTCLRTTLSSLYQGEWAIPSIPVVRENHYLTKISRGLKSEYFANQGLKQLSFGEF